MLLTLDSRLHHKHALLDVMQDRPPPAVAMHLLQMLRTCAFPTGLL